MEPNNIGETKKPSNKKTVIIVVIIVILLVSAGAAAFWWRNDQANKQKAKDEATISQLQKDVADLKKQLASTPTPTPTPTPTATPSSKQPSANTLENIKASFVSKNTAALEGYMAPKVKVVYAATEFGGDKTPAEAVKAMDYVNSGAVAPWDFNLNAATLTKYQNGFYGQYFTATTLVGKSSNGYVVAVNFDSNGKINGIFVSSSDTLLV